MAKEINISLNSSFEEIYAQRNTPLGRFTWDRVEQITRFPTRRTIIDEPEPAEREAAQVTISPRIEALTIDLVSSQLEELARKYQELEFHKHKKLRVSKGALKDIVMKLATPQPESFRGRFDIPIVVFGQISPGDQDRLAGLEYWLRGLNVRDWEADPNGYRTPEIPYITWMQNGAQNLNKSVSTVRKNLAFDERGATIYDGIALYIARPEVLEDHYIDLPGTSVESGRAPCLGRWSGRPRVRYLHVGTAGPGFGSASCGRAEI